MQSIALFLMIIFCILNGIAVCLRRFTLKAIRAESSVLHQNCMIPFGYYVGNRIEGMIL